jgi:tetratricopeptide (TPR) repeat protein
MDKKAKESMDVLYKAWDFDPPMGNDTNKAMSLAEKAIEIDNRNVSAYHLLARGYLKKNDLDKAEKYCNLGYDVKDIPPEISKPSSGVEDVRREIADDFDQLICIIKQKQNKTDEVDEVLSRMREFFEEHSKGKYHVTKKEIDECRSGGETRTIEPQKSGSTTVVVVIIVVLLLIFVIAAVRGC